MRSILYSLILFFSIPLAGFAQGKLYNNNIRSVKLYKNGDQTALPLITLGEQNSLELHFDELGTEIKYYYYTYQLCNADWSPSILRSNEYIRGFQNVRITNYRNSSVSYTKYVHYQTQLPDRNSFPTKSGNYFLKIFLNNDTSQVVFTQRMMVVETKAQVAGQVLQPFTGSLFRTAQRISLAITTDSKIQVLSPSDIKVVILQNLNWQTASLLNRPTIYRGNYFEYSDENSTIFQALKEFRWLDMRSLRLLSDRMLDLQNKKDTVEVSVKPDAPRSSQGYVSYRDLNGRYTLETYDNLNPLWQTDYAYTHFSFFPPGNRVIPGRDVYLFGEMTNYGSDTSGKMIFNPDRGAYEKTLFLKQGYYSYTYMTQPPNRSSPPEFGDTEGNYYATENVYTILVYFRPIGARADELIAMSQLSSFFR